MSVLGKKGHGETAYEVPKDSLYFPSPYATTRVPGYVVEEGSECDSLRSSTRTPSDPQGSHTYDVPFPVRRPEFEEQYSQIKRIPISSMPTTNIYQAPQCCDSEKLVSRWISRPGSEPCTFQMAQEGRHWYPAQYRMADTAYTHDQRLDCSEDENDFDNFHLISQEEDEGPEISETECDRELKIYSEAKGNNSLRVAMPPECQQATLTALTVH